MNGRTPYYVVTWSISCKKKMEEKKRLTDMSTNMCEEVRS